MTEKRTRWGLSFDWKFGARIAVPTLTLVLILFYFSIPGDNQPLSADEILAQVSTEDVIAYLETSDLTADEIVEELDISDIDFDLEDAETPILQLEINDLDALMDEYGIEHELL